MNKLSLLLSILLFFNACSVRKKSNDISEKEATRSRLSEKLDHSSDNSHYMTSHGRATRLNLMND